jgi:integrase
MTRRLEGCGRDELAFSGPRRSNGIPRDLRHTFATWLEDGGVPARVIDELMGHRPAAVASARAP